jgi:hypothetical protein
MRAVAREFNQSETTFLLRADAAGNDLAAALVNAGRRRCDLRRT